MRVELNKPFEKFNVGIMRSHYNQYNVNINNIDKDNNNNNNNNQLSINIKDVVKV